LAAELIHHLKIKPHYLYSAEITGLGKAICLTE
jgi:hypothetical protein